MSEYTEWLEDWRDNWREQSEQIDKRIWEQQQDQCFKSPSLGYKIDMQRYVDQWWQVIAKEHNLNEDEARQRAESEFVLSQ